MQLLGTVRRIMRYPVKSMAGEELAEAALGWHGLEGDRRFAFRRVGDMSGFPWLTAGKLPALLGYRPYYPPGEAGPPMVRVIAPDGADLAGAGPELQGRIAAAYGGPVELLHLKHGIYDEAPLSAISLATMAHLSAAGGVPLDVRRFRPNLLVETPDGQPFAEDAWVGRVIAVGRGAAGPAFSITMRDVRCAMINLDPDSAQADPRLLKAAGRLNAACAGVYGAALRAGPIRVGDALYAAPA
jgi:uncharacterized protein YcbX